MPVESGEMAAIQWSVFGSSQIIRVCRSASSCGPRHTTVAPTASWPSRQTVACTGMCSPTTAFAG